MHCISLRRRVVFLEMCTQLYFIPTLATELNVYFSLVLFRSVHPSTLSLAYMLQATSRQFQCVFPYAFGFMPLHTVSIKIKRTLSKAIPS